MERRRSLKKPMKRANRRLKLMGLTPTIVIEQDEAFMIIPLEQLVRLISKKITHPYKSVTIEESEENEGTPSSKTLHLVVKIWKETKKPILEKV